MARLDEDAAGRLLEGVGDRAPREMTVRMATSDRTRLTDRLRVFRTASCEPLQEAVRSARPGEVSRCALQQWSQCSSELG